jgi:glutamyl-tRNA reductase
MAVWAIGLNHHTAPVDVRGRFTFALDQIGHHLDHLRSAVSPHLEAAILSTCNRTEMYCAGGTRAPAADPGLAGPGRRRRVPDALREYSYSHQDEQAARHAFRVASGLEFHGAGRAANPGADEGRGACRRRRPAPWAAR